MSLVFAAKNAAGLEHMKCTTIYLPYRKRFISCSRHFT